MDLRKTRIVQRDKWSSEIIAKDVVAELKLEAVGVGADDPHAGQETIDLP